MLVSLLGFFGGLGIFLYGTHLLSNGLQKVGAAKMRKSLAVITNTRWKGLLSGIAATFFLQSSTVTNILVVSLVSGSLITLAQAFGIVLGSAIGTTLTVQILTFDVAQYSTVFIFLGAVFLIFIHRQLWKMIGHIMLSIGFIFFGIGLITSSLEPLSDHEVVLHFLAELSENPLLFMLVSTGLTALLHSSAAMIMIGIAFVTSDILTLQAVLPLVLGANLGATLPVVLSGLSSKLEGKKLALFYFFFKGIGVVLVMSLLLIYSKWVSLLPGSPERQIAHFHTLFNIGIALLFFPFLPWIAQLFKKVFPAPKTTEAAFQVQLDDNLLNIPEEALLNGRQEILRLADFVRWKMIKQLAAYIKGTITKRELQQAEQMIDSSYIQIQQYLLKLGQRDLTNKQSNEEVKLLNILNDLEHIGDIVMRFIGKTEKVSEKNISLDAEEQKQLDELLVFIEQSYTDSLTAFKEESRQLARSNIQNQAAISQLEKDIKFDHFNNLINKREHNPDISAVYLDMINQLMQIYHHNQNISRTVLGLI
ncbi:Na/Pi cotransporter family protein [Gracilibacillus alcaliphilus]|uniref:Na/Pi cotransporter family protein n=1 Tax=Gracilibacillus alcaliphilus TaxID=1401441 RepID=UPI00195AB16C|nr:Na/Pi cotransporter family protein [Gracilibacillus alcaliphilus]MBM7679029.1 phosphate:Na+ symporter [Gracilibacillus alcaliphilus]